MVAGDVLAEIEIWHTRPFTPTRRLSIGALNLPVEHSPGFGGLLLGGIVAQHFGEIDDEVVPDVHRLLAQVERGERVVQPRLRHRLQTDRHGLAKSVHRLHGNENELKFDFESNGSDLLQVLGAIYSLERLENSARRALSSVISRAMRWRGPLDSSFISFLAGNASANISAMADPRAWALELLGFPAGTVKPSKRQVQERYRAVLRSVHPDHGGDALTASKSIEEIECYCARENACVVALVIAGVVLFPGAGTNANHQSLVAIETAINRVSTKIKVARCDFEYHKAGKSFPDKTPVLIETVRKAVTQAAHDWGCTTKQIVIGGRSMGGRMCSMAIADSEQKLEVAGLVCVCYPLHPPKQPNKLRSEHLPRVAAPTLFISGTRDEFGTVEELTAATLSMKNKKHVWIEGARHDLKNRESEVGEIIANWIVDL